MFFDPSHTIEQFDLQSGSHVADLGAGAGALTFAAAKSVGEKGRVYAVEVQKELLDRLKNHAKEERLHNVEAVWGDVERQNGTHLKAHAVDAAIASNILFQVEDKEGFVKETWRILKPGGKVLLVDWSESFGGLPAPHLSACPAQADTSRQAGMGPQPEHVVTEQAARELFERHGFRFVKSINARQHHYGMIFRKA